MKIDFNTILKNPRNVNVSQTNQLEQFLKEFPFCNTAQMLYLKGLQNQESFLYNSYLKKVAAYSPNRNILFDYIVNKATKNVKKNKPKETLGAKSKNERVKDKLKIGKPLNFEASEVHTFNQWLQFVNTKPLKQSSNKKSNKELIKDFLRNPKNKISLKGTEKEISINIAEIPISTNSNLVTETLAQIYLEQELWDEAINTYEILRLKYPEKNSFFASKIKEVKKII